MNKERKPEAYAVLLKSLGLVKELPVPVLSSEEMELVDKVLTFCQPRHNHDISAFEIMSLYYGLNGKPQTTAEMSDVLGVSLAVICGRIGKIRSCLKRRDSQIMLAAILNSDNRFSYPSVSATTIDIVAEIVEKQVSDLRYDADILLREIECKNNFAKSLRSR